MKGSPMQRNFGIVSPMKQDKDKTRLVDKIKAAGGALYDNVLNPTNVAKSYNNKKKNYREKQEDDNRSFLTDTPEDEFRDQLLEEKFNNRVKKDYKKKNNYMN